MTAMDSIQSAIEREMANVSALFEEDVELSLWNLGREATYLVTSVDGVETSHRILVSYYYDQSFLSFSDRDPSYRLTVCDLDYDVRFGEVWNHANIEYRVLFDESATDKGLRYPKENYLMPGEKVSLRALLSQAYQMGGYGDRHNLGNSFGIDAEDAAAIVEDAIGEDPASVKPSPKAISDSARDAAERTMNGGECERSRNQGPTL